MNNETEGKATPLAAGAVCARPEAGHYHRRWLVVDDAGQWVGQADRLAAIEVDVRLGYLVLRAEGMLRLDIPLDVIEDDDSVLATAQVGSQRVQVVDEGEVAAVWMSKVLGAPARLVKCHPEDQDVDWSA